MLATRCPACDTVFRVVQDQLRVSEGWVRCGRCGEAFDALDSMIPWPPPTEAASPPRTESPAALPVGDETQAPAAEVGPAASGPDAQRPRESIPEASEPEASEPGASEPDGSEARTPQAQGSEPATAGPTLQGPAGDDEPCFGDGDPCADDGKRPGPSQALEIPPEIELVASDGAMHFGLPPGAAELTLADSDPRNAEQAPDQRVESVLDLAPPSSEDAVPVEEALPPTGPAEAADPEPVISSTPIAAPDAADPASPAAEAMAERAAPAAPSFVQQADRAARWQRPAVRAGLAAFSLLAALALATQLIYAYRDHLAASMPQARPWLQQACAMLGCRIEPYRRIDALSVDSSGLSRIEGSQVYRLTVTLRNRAAVQIAAPALELSLTDAQGGTIARRVLTMSDLGLPLRSLEPASVLPIAAPLSIDGQVSGYTVEVFYP